jgi:solute carrier family 25 carnitine/acylcarnitine transporter 20/29
MSADFWAGYISGAIGIIVGNPLDLIKVRLQATHSTPISNTIAYPPSALSLASQFSSAGSLIRGATAPILGYGALNALLFVTYNRTSQYLSQAQNSGGGTNIPPSLYTTFVAGAVGGLATWVVSTPTELIKCRAQLSSQNSNSWSITRHILRTEGVRGLYFGGVITALRDSIGYGFYFWSYELSTRYMVSRMRDRSSSSAVAGKGAVEEAAKVLLCGGLAGVVTWASIFPLDVIKTRVQVQVSEPHPERRLLLDGSVGQPRLGALQIAKNAYSTEGPGVFFRGLAVCSVRAFIVNAAQWAVYEWIMRELDPARTTISMKVNETMNLD